MISGATSGRGGGALGRHLARDVPGEASRPGEARGLLSEGTRERVRELTDIASPSRSKAALYHTFLSPGLPLTEGQWSEYWERIEREFGLGSQPFVEAIHLKAGQEEHRHRVYGLLRDDGITIRTPHDHARREKVCREFEVNHGLGITTGAHNRAVVQALTREGKMDVVAALEAAGITSAPRPRAPLTPDERHQQQRTGQPKFSIQAATLHAWNSSADGAAFVAALGASGLRLAQGDKTIQVVDGAGGTHDLRRSLNQAARQQGQKGIPAAAVAERLCDVTISSLSETRQEIKTATGIPAERPTRTASARRIDSEQFAALVAGHWQLDDQRSFIGRMGYSGFSPVWCELTTRGGKTVGYPGFERDGFVYSLPKAVQQLPPEQQLTNRAIVRAWSDAGIELRTATLSTERGQRAGISEATRPASDFLRSMPPRSNRRAGPSAGAGADARRRDGGSQQSTASTFVRGNAPRWSGREEDWAAFVLQLAEFCASERVRMAEDSERVLAAMRANADANLAEAVAFIEQFRRDYARASTVRERMNARQNLTTQLISTGVPNVSAHAVKRSLTTAGTSMAADGGGLATRRGAGAPADATRPGGTAPENARREGPDPAQLRGDPGRSEQRRPSASARSPSGAGRRGADPTNTRSAANAGRSHHPDRADGGPPNRLAAWRAARSIERHAATSLGRLARLTAALDASNQDGAGARKRQENRRIHAEQIMLAARDDLAKRHPGRPPWSPAALDPVALARPEVERLITSVSAARKKAEEARAVADAHPTPTGLRALFSKATAEASARFAKVAEATESELRLAEAAMRTGVPWAENQATKTVKSRRKAMDEHQQKLDEHTRETQVLSQVWRLYQNRDPDVVAALEGDGLKAALEQVARKMVVALRQQREAQQQEEERLERERIPSAPGSMAMRRRA